MLTFPLSIKLLLQQIGLFSASYVLSGLIFRETSGHLNNMSDQDLLTEYKKTRGEHLFRELYHRYKDMIYSYVRRYLCYSEDDTILDLVDKIFIKTYLKLPDLKETVNFKNWLYTIAHNQCVDFFKIKKPEVRDGESYISRARDHRIDIEKEYMKNELVAFLLEALESLEGDTRELVVMRYFQGMSHKEISDVTDKSERVIMYQLEKALGSLELKLRKGGFNEDVL
ncbi:MAG: RNA polymerase sigma factor [bacterium]|nr:RNA polymerase sigma factor [bacterium]